MTKTTAELNEMLERRLNGMDGYHHREREVRAVEKIADNKELHRRVAALEAERDAVWDELYQTKFALGQEQGENAALRAKLEAHDE